jgi:hypothetical protein
MQLQIGFAKVSSSSDNAQFLAPIVTSHSSHLTFTRIELLVPRRFHAKFHARRPLTRRGLPRNTFRPENVCGNTSLLSSLSYSKFFLHKKLHSVTVHVFGGAGYMKFSVGPLLLVKRVYTSSRILLPDMSAGGLLAAITVVVVAVAGALYIQRGMADWLTVRMAYMTQFFIDSNPKYTTQGPQRPISYFCWTLFARRQQDMFQTTQKRWYQNTASKKLDPHRWMRSLTIYSSAMFVSVSYFVSRIYPRPIHREYI